MKKLFLIGLAATAMLTSCSNDETVDMVQSKAIGFSNAFVDNGTRSIIDPSLTKDKLEDFAVYGFTQNGKIFDGVKVYKGGTASIGWSYDPVQYWVPGNTYTFGAIAPFSVAANVSGVALSADASKVGMSVAFTNTDATQIDLLHAAPTQITGATVTESYQTPVSITFKHQLAKVKFSFLNSVGEAYTVKVTNIKINDAKETGTLTIAANTDNVWSAQDGSLSLNFGDAATTDEAASIAYSTEVESYNEKLMIPTGVDATYNVTFDVALYKDNVLMGTSSKEVTISSVELKLGYCYDFKAELTFENVLDDKLHPIEFTVTDFINWIPEQEKDLTVE